MALLPFSTQVLEGVDYIFPAPTEDFSGETSFGTSLAQSLMAGLSASLSTIGVTSTLTDFDGGLSLVSRAGVDGKLIDTFSGVNSMPQLCDAISELANPSLILIQDQIRRLAAHEVDFRPETLTAFLIEAFAARQKDALKGVMVGTKSEPRPWPQLEQHGLLPLSHNYAGNACLFGVTLAAMRLAQLPPQLS